jgi:hypothetical protein
VDITGSGSSIISVKSLGNNKNNKSMALQL